MGVSALKTQRAYLVSKPSVDIRTESDSREYWSDYSDTHFLSGHHTYFAERTYRVRAVRQATSLYAMHAFRQEGQKEVRHTVRHARDKQDEVYHLFAVTHGESVLLRQGETEAELRPGMAVLATQAKPFDMRVGGFSGFVLAVPHAELNARLDSKSPLETAIDTSKGMGRLALDMLRGLHEERANLTEQEFNAVCGRLIELLCMITVGDDCPDPSHLREIESGVRRYVHDHAGDRTLSLSAVAAALGWSPRRLQEVMAQAGTTYRDLVREERLTAARRMLRDSAGQTITEVAARSGFASSNVLSMLFRERYGETPRDYRHRVGA